ncbi:DRTGG domain-containing protein [Alkaliphilus peptidifermentans]|uniref:DRTGG domain-containing protein n=1 Tax=Alkaliphilus peptidifermentans DSM 18978 TaxID=1120976 RepID=A0A1G5DNY7_9FIRM|nr:DRTGG domain-containing protein [Alkaliphilus peptidifermentans]SCY16424.1 DRTGG domain-containing protein [Alkaliphilus peptidifermentans DSM 18978]
MLVKELIEALNLELIAGEEGTENKITGVYISDLLSWVMAKLQAGNVWITIQTHVNVVAVALLGEASCMIIPEGADIDENTIAKANEEKIPLLRSQLTAYELALKIKEVSKI